MGGITSLVAYLAARGFTSPIIHLLQIAQQVGQGDLDARAKVKSRDEIGLLANTFNSTTSQLQYTLKSLEQRVNARTKDLSRRAIQLQTASELARDATTIRDREQLLNRVTHLIADRFGFYHVGIFFLTGNYAVLQATNSQGGQKMLKRGHRLEVGETGIVGYTAATGEARIALDVGEDAIFFDNPDLPETRSEIALPLKIGSTVIGVLDVQSKQSGAFSTGDIEILQILADQVAIALDNARLLEQSQKALANIDALYGEQILESWNQYLETQSHAYHYIAGARTATPLSASPESQKNSQAVDNLVDDKQKLTAPLTIRGQAIGEISFQRDNTQNPWTEDDRRLLTQAIEQIGIMLETTRLHEDTQRRAASERLAGKIANRLRATLDIDTIIKTAAEEIRQNLELPEVTVQLLPPQQVTSSEEKGA